MTESTVIFPRPAACDANGSTAMAAAIKVALKRFCLSVLGTATPDGLFIMSSKPNVREGLGRIDVIRRMNQNQPGNPAFCTEDDGTQPSAASGVK